MVRGGSWAIDFIAARSSGRFGYPRDTTNDDVGFRCADTPDSAIPESESDEQARMNYLASSLCALYCLSGCSGPQRSADSPAGGQGQWPRPLAYRCRAGW